MYQSFAVRIPGTEAGRLVEDLDSFLKGSVAVVPIRIGSGMRMKILDCCIVKSTFCNDGKGCGRH